MICVKSYSGETERVKSAGKLRVPYSRARREVLAVTWERNVSLLLACIFDAETIMHALHIFYPVFLWTHFRTR
jgi:hypothetical protein